MGIHQTAGFLKNLANCTATGSDWCWDEVGKIGKIRECPTEKEIQNLIAQVGAITNSLDTTKNNLVKAFEKLLNLLPGTVARVTKQCHPRGRRGSIGGMSSAQRAPSPGPVRPPASWGSSRGRSLERGGKTKRNLSREASMTMY